MDGAIKTIGLTAGDDHLPEALSAEVRTATVVVVVVVSAMAGPAPKSDIGRLICTAEPTVRTRMTRPTPPLFFAPMRTDELTIASFAAPTSDEAPKTLGMAIGGTT